MSCSFRIHVENVICNGFQVCFRTTFEYERSYRELSLKQIYKRRLKDEKPVIEAFLSWFDKLHPEAGGRIVRAVTYTNNCRPYMMNYLQDGAAASMRVYSMVETAKANGLDPLKYLMFLLENRPSAEMSDGELALLAPWSTEAMDYCK